MKKKLLIIGIAAAAVVIAAAAGIMSRRGGLSGGLPGASGVPGMGGAGMGASRQQASYAMVRAEKPYTGTVTVTSTLTGTVEAADQVYLYAKASGDVTAVHVKAGDVVEAGDTLLEINTNQIQSSENQLNSAKVQFNTAQANLNRNKTLFDGGFISSQEYDQFKASYESAKIQLDNARYNYDQQVSYSTIKAPIGGRIESCSVDVYDNIDSRQELCVIAGEGDSRLEFYVTERMAAHLEPGDELEISKNGKTYPGHITEVSSMVDASTGLFRGKAELEKTDEIAIGSTVKIRLVTDKAENALCVPTDAVYYSGGNAYVYVVEDNTAHMRGVEVGLYNSEDAEILSGLEKDDLVVKTWSNNLYEGAKVRLAGEAGEAKPGERNPGEGKAGEGNSGARQQNGSGQAPSREPQ